MVKRLVVRLATILSIIFTDSQIPSTSLGGMWSAGRRGDRPFEPMSASYHSLG